MSKSMIERYEEKVEAFYKLTGLDLDKITGMRNQHLAEGGSIPTQIQIPLDLMICGMKITLKPLQHPATICSHKTSIHLPGERLPKIS